MRFRDKLVFFISIFILAGSWSISLAQDITTSDCMECHSDPELTKVGKDSIVISLFIDENKYTNSVHGDLECVDCHADITELPHEENLQKPDCATCHDDILEEYLNSVHGRLYAAGDKNAPQCWSCHDDHYVYPSSDSLSTLSIFRQPKTCATCHADPELIKLYNIPISKPCELYSNSVHYKAALKEGCYNAARCTDCHGGHDIEPSSKPTSHTNRYNVPKTCSKCHQDVYQQYAESVHGKALEAGASDAPVCTDCHTEHNIKHVKDPSSTVYSSVISKTLCPRCHEAERIVTKYGIEKNVVKSYADSYHGLAVRGGSVVAANCASCHGVHDILPSSDPKSSINKKNLPKTCGKCHPGASNEVIKGRVHIRPSKTSKNIIYYVTIFYYTLIILTIGGMVLHNGLDFLKKLKAKFREETPVTFESTLTQQIERLTLNERIQHFLLMGSFTTLVYTGFAMRFPEAWWAAPLIRWEGGFAFRGFLHRAAATVMITVGIYHLYYIGFTKRGREHIKAFLPKIKDVTDLIHNLKYFLGLEKEPPKFARYSYIEKMEYLALIWGTIIMSVTGLILWFNDFSLKHFPKWVSDVSTVIHYFEAVLATLAILVWHFYYQFFDPRIYPMNTTCLTGKMSAEEYREEHPLDFERAISEDKK